MAVEYIVDSDVILRSPDVVRCWNPDVALIVPQEVVDELAGLEERGGVSHVLVEDTIAARNAGFVGTGDALGPPPRTVDGHVGARLSETDAALLHRAASSRDAGRDARLATSDPVLALAAAQRGVPVLRAEELAWLQQRSVAVRLSELRPGETLAQNRRRTARWGVGLGVGITLLALLIFENALFLSSHINRWVLVAALPLVGASLYLFRSRSPLGYGILEVVVGGITAAWILLSDARVDYGIADSLGVVGGLYVMVRGFTNLSIGIRGRRIHRWWLRVFGARS